MTEPIPNPPRWVLHKAEPQGVRFLAALTKALRESPCDETTRHTDRLLRKLRKRGYCHIATLESFRRQRGTCDCTIEWTQRPYPKHSELTQT